MWSSDHGKLFQGWCHTLQSVEGDRGQGGQGWHLDRTLGGSPSESSVRAVPKGSPRGPGGPCPDPQSPGGRSGHAHLKMMLDAGVIRPSNSPWCNAVVLVRKKDGSLHFCINFRRLNSYQSSLGHQ